MNHTEDMRLRHRAIIFGAWLAAVLTSAIVLWAYEKRPSGLVTEATMTWPINDLVACDPDRPTVVMFAHPKCPCTRASLRELAKLADTSDASVLVVFYVPSGANESWHQTANTELASAIPGANVLWDRDGTTARRFDVDVSGQCVAFSPQEILLYSGGITISRGHEGDNLGAASLAQCLKTSCCTTPGLEKPQREPQIYPVYGCTLFSR